MKIKKIIINCILGLVLSLVILAGLRPMMANAAASEAISLLSNQTYCSYSDGVVQYYKYNGYLYKVTYTNMTGYDQVCLSVDGQFRIYKYESSFRNLFRSPEGGGNNQIVANGLPKDVNTTLNAYFTNKNNNSPAVDPNQPSVIITCIGVGEPVWTWSGTTSASAVFTSTDGNVTMTMNGTITSNITQTAGSCMEKDKVTYTATAIANGRTYTNAKLGDGGVGPHSYIYSRTMDNVVVEGCTNCEHSATAMLTAVDATYTGSAITTANVIYSDNWGGSKEHSEITYSNNTNVGDANANVTVAGKELITTFEINPLNITGANVTMDPENGTYIGSAYTPNITVNYNGATLVQGTDYTISWNKTGFTNVDSYIATIAGVGNYDGTVTKTFTITKKEIGISWGSTQFMYYTGQLIVPEVLVTGLIDGDDCEAIVSVVETVDGAGVNPGQWTARITGLSNSNYKLPENSSLLEVRYTIDVDQTAPDAEIKVKDHSWTELLNNITFGVFFKKMQDVTIMADDAESGVKNIEYYLSNAKLSESELEDINAWEGYDGTFKIKKDSKYVIYAKITDNVGNVRYISSDGIVLDTTAPVISGVEDGKTYYTTQKVSVTDKNIASITMNGETKGNEIILEGNKNEIYTIVATDKAGNSTSVTVTMKRAGVPSAPIDTLNKDNVNNSNEQIIKDNNSVLESENPTEDEQKSLDDSKTKADGMLETNDENLESNGNVEKVEGLIDKLPANISKNDEAAIKAAVDAYNALTDYEKSLMNKETKKKLDDAKEALAKWNKTVELNDSANGDNSNIILWSVIIFISGCAVITLPIVYRKKIWQKKDK